MTDLRIYLTTVQNKKDAKLIAEALLKNRVSACINIIEKMTSMYVWNGNICEDSECLLIIKSNSYMFEKVKKIVLSMHKYELPEFIEIPVTNGFEDYLKWAYESVK